MIKRGMFTPNDRFLLENLPTFDTVKFVDSLCPGDLLQKVSAYSDAIIMIEALDISSETKKVVENALTDKICQLLEQFEGEANAEDDKECDNV